MADQGKDNAPVRILPCPTCGKSAAWSERNRFRPFCSERCRLIDLGEWASEGHVIPGQSLTDGVMSGDLGDGDDGTDLD